MQPNRFSLIASLSLAVSLTAAALSLIGIAFTGFYPGIIVLIFVALIPIASKFYAKKNASKSTTSRNTHTILTILNLLVILVVLWMTFVIVHDRILQADDTETSEKLQPTKMK